MNKARLQKQIDFIVEVDKLKQVLRQSVITGALRNENDAEHSWHLALMAILLSEYAEAKDIDVLRVIKMVLIHDLVEIDAGDTYCYDEKANQDKAQREQLAADRIFNLLPPDQAREIMSLWREFEEITTPEARFAACLDRMEPLLLNYNTNGHTWKRPGVNSQKVYKRVDVLEKNAPTLYEYIKDLIESSVEKGYLKR